MTEQELKAIVPVPDSGRELQIMLDAARETLHPEMPAGLVMRDRHYVTEPVTELAAVATTPVGTRE